MKDAALLDLILNVEELAEWELAFVTHLARMLKEGHLAKLEDKVRDQVAVIAKKYNLLGERRPVKGGNVAPLVGAPTAGEKFAASLLAKPMPKAPPMRLRGDR